MRRREFITLLGAAAAWPVVARGQQATMPVIGFLRSTSLIDAAHLVDAFRHGLKETGFVEGQNVAIEYRSAEDQGDRLPVLVADLVRGDDPVKDGLVASLSRPGGNVTGVSFLNSVLAAKRLELLHQTVPNATIIGAMLQNPVSSGIEAERRDLLAAAQAIGQQLIVLDVSSDREIEDAFTTLVQRGASGAFVGTGAFMNSQRERIVALAARHRLPAIYNWREAVAAGGLMSYAPSIADAYRQAGIYAGRILKGEKPADLPVMLPTKFELVVNRKTATELGLEIPDRLLALADEVIE
jgi:putative ABC transport system substrate-binding protein